MNPTEFDEGGFHTFAISWSMIEYLVEDLEQNFPKDRIGSTTLISLYYAAKMNHATRLVTTLNAITNKELVNCLVNLHFSELDGHVVTPLAIAAIQNNTTFVKTLLSHYMIDVEKECNVMFDGLVVYGATALWIAAGMGHLQIVKLLVKHGADVNHNTKAHSSPLRAACYDGRLEIVKYLIKHGANVNLANPFNNTSIMIAASKGHVHVVETLLQNGANPNEQALCGATALHYAAECGHLDVCTLLLDHGARILKNEHGLTPVLLAAERLHEKVVHMFIERPNLMTKLEVITALELLGASFANDKDYYNVNKAYTILMRAMEMRYADPDNIIRKQVMAPVPAYDDWFETENIPELKAIRLNHHSMHMEALTIRERILGKHNVDVVQPIVYRGAIMADLGRYSQCQTLWNYAIDLRMINNVSVEVDLQRFVQLFAQILRSDIETLDLSIVLSVLVKCQQEIENNKYKIKNPGPKDVPPMLADQNEQNICTALHLIKIIARRISHAPDKIEKSQIELLYSTIYQFIKCDTRLINGQTMLHLACNNITPVEDSYSSEVCVFPCYRTALILVHVGASVNAIDNQQMTPLHTLACSVSQQPSSNSIPVNECERIVKLLVEAGAHLDSVDFDDKTPAQISDIPEISNLILNYQNSHSTLKCLAARTIAIHSIAYRGMVPQTLESFIKMHTSKKCRRKSS